MDRIRAALVVARDRMASPALLNCLKESQMAGPNTAPSQPFGTAYPEWIQARDGVLAIFPSRPVAWVLRRLVFQGAHAHRAARQVEPQGRGADDAPGAARDRLTAGAYVPRDEKDVVGRLEFAMEAVIPADPLEGKVRKAAKEGKLPQRTLAERRQAAVGLGVITPAEHEQLLRADRLVQEVIRVEDFPTDLSRAAKPEDAW